MQKTRIFAALLLCVISSFWSSCVLARHEQSNTKILNLSAHIENKQFFSYKVTKFGFEDNDFGVTYNAETKSFNPISTHMIVETDIPLGFASGLEIIPSNLNSQCISIDGKEEKQGFAHYSLGQQELTQGAITKIGKINDKNGSYLKDYRLFEVLFDPLKDIDVTRSNCSGKAVLLVSLDF